MGRHSNKKRSCIKALAAAVPAIKLLALERRIVSLSASSSDGTAASACCSASSARALADGDAQDADAPSTSGRTRGNTGLRALIFRPYFMEARDCVRLVDRLRSALAAGVEKYYACSNDPALDKTGSVLLEKCSSEKHPDGWHFCVTAPQHCLFQAARGYNATHTGLSVFGEGFARQLYDKLHDLLSSRYDLDELNALYDAACPDIPRLWPDLPFNGFDLVGFGARFFKVGKRAKARCKVVLHQDTRDVLGIPAIIVYLDVDDNAEPFVVYPCSGDLKESEVLERGEFLSVKVCVVLLCALPPRSSRPLTSLTARPPPIKPRTGCAFVLDSVCHHRGSKAAQKLAVVFMANVQLKDKPLVKNPWSPEWRALGAYMETVHPAAVAWHARREAGQPVPRVLTPAHALEWLPHLRARVANSSPAAGGGAAHEPAH